MAALITDFSILALDVKHSAILGISDDGKKSAVIVPNCTGVPDGIVVDPVGKHIYWTNMGIEHTGEDFNANDGWIERADFDGSNRTRIIPQGNIFTPKQIQIDLKGKRLYWCDREGMRVMRANLDGSEITTLVQTGSGDADRKDKTRHCVGIALDLAGGHIYWTLKGPPNGNVGRIARVPIDLAKGEDPAHRSDIEILWDKLPEPIDLELSADGTKLYWSDRGNPPKGNTINRGDVSKKRNGSYDILVKNLHEAIGLAIDEKNNQMAFSDLGDSGLSGTKGGEIYTSKMDGSDSKVIYSGDHAFTGICYVPKV